MINIYKKMEEKLIDIITIGVIVYTCIMLISFHKKHDNVIKDLKIRYNNSKLEASIGIILFIIIMITNIYYNRNYERLDKNLQSKTRRLYEATIAGIIALLIAWLAFLDKILGAFFLIFVVHYYFSLTE
jgi:uncharacterized protein YacL